MKVNLEVGKKNFVEQNWSLNFFTSQIMGVDTEFRFVVLDKPRNEAGDEAPPCQYSDGFCGPYFEIVLSAGEHGMYVKFLRENLKKTFPTEPADCQSCVAEVETAFTDKKTARAAIKELFRLINASKSSEWLPPRPRPLLLK